MLNGINDFIKGFNEISEFAKRGDKHFPDEICNFLTKEFKLETAALFKVEDDKSLSFLGKSNNLSNEFSKSSKFICENCRPLLDDNPFVLYTNSNCKIKISDSAFHEACALIKTSESNRVLLKIAHKIALVSDKNQKSLIEDTLQLLGLLFQIWFNKKTTASDSFLNLVNNTTQELKSYANSIIGSSTILTESNNSQIEANKLLVYNNADYLLSIKKNAQSILLNINDLGELTKYESKSLVLNLRKFDLIKFIDEIVKLFKSRLSNKQIIFDVEISPNIPQPVEQDEQKLKYILSNLLYISTILTEGGKITVKVFPLSNKKLSFIISNEGKNLPDEIINNFFEPFSLLQLPEFKNSNLTGLSPTLVKKYINFLGGDISVIRNPLKGTTFNFTITGVAMSDIETKISNLFDGSKLPHPSSKNKVLVIEDDYATSKLLNNYLNKWGYVPVIVNTEEQAFNIINSEPLLAVILDIELPNTNGLELLKKIHEHPNTKNVPVIVCSIEPEEQKAFMMGAVEYFVKPINYNYLVEVLTSYKLRKDSTVLCVDDDVPTLNLLKQAIESAGFNALAESVSARVMDLIKEKDIDLAIIDLDMPTPNGFELIKMIKSEKRFANLPIIIYTGKENYREDLHKIEGLFEELLEKRSTNIEDLADTINAMINRYEVPPPAEEVLSKKGVKKILLAEDYKHSQIIVTRLLKKNNFEDIVVVENGEDAVKMARQEKFDLILMDMQMPIMNGFEATEKIRQMPEYKDVPIIALTAFAMKGDREKCLEVGATDYIPKPIDSKEFIDKIKYYTNS